MKNKRKHIPQRKLPKEEVRQMMEQKLKARKIPSKKKYNRKNKEEWS